MTGLYSHKFTGGYGTEPTPEWKMAVRDCSPEMIKRGLDRCVKEFPSWPPNPIEFRNLCYPTPEEMGLPSNETAFLQAVGSIKERHPAVIYALRNLGAECFRLRHSDEKTARDMFNKVWAQTIEFVANGGDLPEPEKQIPERPAGTEAGRQKAGAKALAEMRGMFG